MGDRRGAYRAVVGKSEGEIQLEDLGGRIILKLNLQEDSYGAWQGEVAGCCKAVMNLEENFLTS